MARRKPKTDVVIADSDTITSYLQLTRDEDIIFKHWVKHISQTQLGDMFGLSQQRISQICNRWANDEAIQTLIVTKVKKGTATLARLKAYDTVKSYDDKGLHDGEKPKAATFLHNLANDIDGIGPAGPAVAIQINVTQYGEGDKVVDVKQV